MRRNEPYGNGRGGLEALLAEPALASDWESIEPEPTKVVRTMFSPEDKPGPGGGGGGRRPRRPEPVEDDSAVKKFGSAKAISSAQFFGEQVALCAIGAVFVAVKAKRSPLTDAVRLAQDDKWERDANLSRFAGSSSISSAEYFGGERAAAQQRAPQGFTVSAPDLDEVRGGTIARPGPAGAADGRRGAVQVRESVRLGVTRVAGRLSSLANGVVSSIQERYGY